MLAITHHHDPGRLEPLAGEDVRDQVALVGPPPVELAAVYALEEPGQGEVLDDSHGEDLRLGGDDEGAIAEGTERPHRLGRLRIERVPEQAAIERERPVQERAVRGVQQAGEASTKGRADTPVQIVGLGGRPAEPGHRVLDAARDSRLGVGERPVQAEKDGTFVHRRGSSLISAGIAAEYTPAMRRRWPLAVLLGLAVILAAAWGWASYQGSASGLEGRKGRLAGARLTEA